MVNGTWQLCFGSFLFQTQTSWSGSFVGELTWQNVPLIYDIQEYR